MVTVGPFLGERRPTSQTICHFRMIFHCSSYDKYVVIKNTKTDYGNTLRCVNHHSDKTHHHDDDTHHHDDDSHHHDDDTHHHDDDTHHHVSFLCKITPVTVVSFYKPSPVCHAICCVNAGSMVGHRLRRWRSIKPALAEHLVFAWVPRSTVTLP